jgi:hypothetical protein
MEKIDEYIVKYAKSGNLENVKMLLDIGKKKLH